MLALLIQVALFSLAVFFRTYFLQGRHLKKDKAKPERLVFRSVGKAGKVNYLHIGLPVGSDVACVIMPEHWYHRLWKAMGFAQEVQVRDDVFDKKQYIATDYPVQFERFLTHRGLLPPLQALFALPVRSLHVTKNKIWCVIKKPDRDKPLDFFTRHEALLQEIATALRGQMAADPYHRPAEPLVKVVWGMIGAHMGFLLLGLTGFWTFSVDSIEVLDRAALMHYGLSGGVALAALWAFIIFFLLGRTSWVSWVLSDFIAFGIVGLVLSGLTFARDVDVDLVQPAPTVYQERLVERTCQLECSKSCGKNCTKRSHYTYSTQAECTASVRAKNIAEKRASDPICAARADFKYYLTVSASWPHYQGTSYRFSTDSVFFDHTQAGMFLSVPVHAGALGLPWIDKAEISQ